MTRCSSLVVLTVAIASVVAVSACGSDPSSADGGGSCQCALQTALQTTYDHASSMLGASNVQDAVDELAARPLPEMPVGKRLESVVVMADNTGAADLSVTGACPDQAHDVALGGSCAAIVGAVLEGFSLQNGTTTAGVQCQYKQTPATTDKVSITIMCLHMAK